MFIFTLPLKGDGGYYDNSQQTHIQITESLIRQVICTYERITYNILPSDSDHCPWGHNFLHSLKLCKMVRNADEMLFSNNSIMIICTTDNMHFP